jgi:hypothetical protein
MTYRKQVDSKKWHCCRNCPHWPEGRGEYVDRNSKPMSEELCGQCLALMHDGDCIPPATIQYSLRRSGVCR